MKIIRPTAGQFERLHAVFGNHTKAARALGYLPESYREVRRSGRISNQGALLVHVLTVLLHRHPALAAELFPAPEGEGGNRTGVPCDCGLTASHRVE